jgi:hypothetical protein
MPALDRPLAYSVIRSFENTFEDDTEGEVTGIHTDIGISGSCITIDSSRYDPCFPSPNIRSLPNYSSFGCPESDFASELVALTCRTFGEVWTLVGPSTRSHQLITGQYTGAVTSGSGWSTCTAHPAVSRLFLGSTVQTAQGIYGEAELATAPSVYEALVSRLSEWQSRLAPHLVRAMAAHLNRMFAEPDQDEDEDETITPVRSSLDDLLRFLSERPWVKAPALGLTRDGKFQAAWNYGDRPNNANLTLVFLGQSNVRWYRLDARKRTLVRHGTGVDPLDELAAVIDAMGANPWMTA